jgi:hypothetical protein
MVKLLFGVNFKKGRMRLNNPGRNVDCREKTGSNIGFYPIFGLIPSQSRSISFKNLSFDWEWDGFW